MASGPQPGILSVQAWRFLAWQSSCLRRVAHNKLLNCVPAAKGAASTGQPTLSLRLPISKALNRSTFFHSGRVQEVVVFCLHWAVGIRDRAILISAVSFLVLLVSPMVQSALRIERGLSSSSNGGAGASGFYPVPYFG